MTKWKQFPFDAFRPLGLHWTRFVYIDVTTDVRERVTQGILNLEKNIFFFYICITVGVFNNNDEKKKEHLFKYYKGVIECF